MKSKKKVFLSILILFILIIIYYVICFFSGYNFNRITFSDSILLNIFGGCFLLLVVYYLEYLVEKHKNIEFFFNQAYIIILKFYHITNQEK